MTTATNQKPFSQEIADSIQFARDCYGLPYNETEIVDGLEITGGGYGVILRGPEGLRTISLDEFNS